MNKIKIDTLIRSRRRSIGLQIAQDATLIVRAPVCASLSDVQRIVEDKRDWIIRKQEMVRTRIAHRKEKQFIQGEEFHYLGKKYTLKFVHGTHKPFLVDNNLAVSESERDPIQKLLSAWYRSEALRIIRERVEHFAGREKLKVKSVKISSAKRRWGSCGPSGSLNFNWRLIMAPLFVLDYVVVHELAHIEIRDHSKRFWDKVAVLMPEYAHAERWLKDNHWELDI